MILKEKDKIGYMDDNVFLRVKKIENLIQDFIRVVLTANKKNQKYITIIIFYLNISSSIFAVEFYVNHNVLITAKA